MKIEVKHKRLKTGTEFLEVRSDGHYLTSYSISEWRTFNEAMRLCDEYISKIMASEPTKILIQTIETEGGTIEIFDEIDVVGDKFILVYHNDVCARCFSYDKFGTSRDQAIETAILFANEISQNTTEINETIKTILL